ncbi:serine/threonine protein kinase [Roseimaritima ulvae]|uniref:Serine/threonine-protein kinase PrkC n=1 Tax=Roseimaritima ulvae TaxID=980254 RepID=A0A5B9QL17_9BACT|nr:serine/threonine-protein kinase [Roseimaritima ulvae]QEG39778.1 Serine/threonine-protein kinase PrkC [Roseimaritima ulvae]
MGFLDSLRSLLPGSSDASSADGPEGSSDKHKDKKASTKSSGKPKKKSTAAARTKCDIEARFERMRSSVSGTMGNFFLARDRQLKRIVGVKVCDPEKVELFEARFKGLKKPSEGEIAMQMMHPRVMETLEHGETTRGERYLVTEYIEGPSLQHVVQTANEEEVAGKRVNLIRQMAEAIAYVHSKEFIHRDICPRNFICLPDLVGLKLIDFGLTVPATPPFMTPGNRTGTPVYMSPEIVRRRSTDKRVDIFSFGMSAYCLLTFQFPWNVTDTTGRAALQHDTALPTDIFERRPNLDPRLGKAIMHCLQPKAEDRMPSMTQFLQQISRVEQEEQ